MNSFTPHRTAVSRWAQVGVLLLVFAAGGIVGAMVTAKTIHSRMSYYRDHPEALPAAIVPKLKYELGLNDEQVVTIKGIINLRHSKITEYQQLSAQSIHNEFKLMEDDVAEVLDSEQKLLWRELTNIVKERYLPKIQPGGVPAGLSDDSK